MLDAAGLSAIDSKGNYNFPGERGVQKIISSGLMAIVVCIFFETSSMLLPWRWSLIVTIGAGFGTQIWSTATRALWSNTWEVFLAECPGPDAAEAGARIESLQWSAAGNFSFVDVLRAAYRSEYGRRSQHIYSAYQSRRISHLCIDWIGVACSFSDLFVGRVRTVAPGLLSSRIDVARERLVGRFCRMPGFTVAWPSDLCAIRFHCLISSRTELEQAFEPAARPAGDWNNLRTTLHDCWLSNMVGWMVVRPSAFDRRNSVVRRACCYWLAGPLG
jgi:hypothetical protein